MPFEDKTNEEEKNSVAKRDFIFFISMSSPNKCEKSNQYGELNFLTNRLLKLIIFRMSDFHSYQMGRGAQLDRCAA